MSTSEATTGIEFRHESFSLKFRHESFSASPEIAARAIVRLKEMYPQLVAHRISGDVVELVLSSPKINFDPHRIFETFRPTDPVQGTDTASNSDLRVFWNELLGEKKREPGEIFQPPGRRLNQIAEFLYSQKTYRRVFVPAITDMQEEVFEALSKGRRRKAQWIHICGIVSFAMAMLAHAIEHSKTVWKLPK